MTKQDMIELMPIDIYTEHFAGKKSDVICKPLFDSYWQSKGVDPNDAKFDIDPYTVSFKLKQKIIPEQGTKVKAKKARRRLEINGSDIQIYEGDDFQYNRRKLKGRFSGIRPVLPN